MLFYRRVAPEVNIVEVSEDDIPTSLLREIELDEEQRVQTALKKKAEEERQKDCVTFFAFHEVRGFLTSIWHLCQLFGNSTLMSIT